MATKRTRQENFYIELNDGRTLGFYCWTTKTRCGWCQTCWCIDNDTTSKSSYINYPYEPYAYHNVLMSAFGKLDKRTRDELIAWDTAKQKKDHEECEKFVDNFKKVYEETPQSFKDKLAESNVMLENEEQAQSLMGLMKMATLLEKVA